MSGSSYNTEHRPEHHPQGQEETPAVRDQADSGPFIPPQQPGYADAATRSRTGAGEGQLYDSPAGADYDTVHGRYSGAGVGQVYDPHGAAGAPGSDRPMNVKPTTQGGVAVGGQSDPPMGQAGMGDKIIGKTQKVVGKMMHDPELHEKGELRESGGKAATVGKARAPHD